MRVARSGRRGRGGERRGEGGKRKIGRLEKKVSSG